MKEQFSKHFLIHKAYEAFYTVLFKRTGLEGGGMGEIGEEVKEL